MTSEQMLLQALETGDASVLRMACRAGALPSEKHLLQALEQALQAEETRGWIPLLRILAEAGADPRKPVRDGLSCLELVRQSNKLELYWVLVSATPRLPSP